MFRIPLFTLPTHSSRSPCGCSRWAPGTCRRLSTHHMEFDHFNPISLKRGPCLCPLHPRLHRFPSSRTRLYSTSFWRWLCARPPPCSPCTWCTSLPPTAHRTATTCMTLLRVPRQGRAPSACAAPIITNQDSHDTCSIVGVHAKLVQHALSLIAFCIQDSAYTG